MRYLSALFLGASVLVGAEDPSASPFEKRLAEYLQMSQRNFQVAGEIEKLAATLVKELRQSPEAQRDFLRVFGKAHESEAQGLSDLLMAGGGSVVRDTPVLHDGLAKMLQIEPDAAKRRILETILKVADGVTRPTP